MRVAVNTLFLIPGEVGGSETYTLETLAALARHCPDLALQVLSNRENDALMRARLGAFRQVEVHALPVRAANRYARIVAEQTLLPSALRRLRPDVLWSPGYTAPWWAPCPQVVTIHDMQYRRFPEDLRPLARWTTHVLVSQAARRCDRILAVSEFARDEVVRFTSARPERIEVTPEAVDPAFADRVPAEELAQRVRGATGGEGPYLLTVSNTYPHKNVAALVEGFGQVEGGVPHRLVVVGRPRLGEPAVQAACARLADPARVVRRERVERRDLVALYQGAAAFVFPSLYEGFGLPLLEAMMAGAPVIATGCASIREVAGACAVWAPEGRAASLAAAVREVLGWPADQRAAWVSRARAHASRFTWEATARATAAALARTAGPGQG